MCLLPLMRIKTSNKYLNQPSWHLTKHFLRLFTEIVSYETLKAPVHLLYVSEISWQYISLVPTAGEVRTKPTSHLKVKQFDDPYTKN